MAKRWWFTILHQKFKILQVSPYRFNIRLNQTSTGFSDPICNRSTGNKISTLFVPGRHGNVMYQIVKPLIDVNYIIENMVKIKHSCNVRDLNFDFESAVIAIKEWHSVRTDYLLMVDKEQFYAEEIKRLKTIGDEKEASKVIAIRLAFVENLKAEKERLLSIEDTVMPLLQKIPALVHAETPVDSNVSISQIETFKGGTQPLSHVEIGEKLSSLQFCDNSTMYFMSGKISALDLGIQMYFFDKFKALEFIPMSCVDFCKSFIVEAIGCDPYSNSDTIPLHEKTSKEIGQKLHLCGGASFESFCAYLTNMNVDKSNLPLKYFSLGRRYNARNRESGNKDLFSVIQSTNLHYAIISECLSSDDFDSLFQEMVTLYKEIKIPFQTVDVAAKNLNVAESRRKQLELWSPSRNHYVPVAHLSQHNDFISKRLNITYGIQHANEGYCHIMEGVSVNVPVLIGCIIENLQIENDFDIPGVLQKNFRLFSS
ncbi:serine--tRNA ligase-like [Uloborus diversus]|uniref:serine--tRNA ligase-like n=1 Tax=Uloborus diversus TaxID=327109 RepID=UPI00240A556E|nr:serine--tRNA ligase-like [Uloborus diversus]